MIVAWEVTHMGFGGSNGFCEGSHLACLGEFFLESLDSGFSVASFLLNVGEDSVIFLIPLSGVNS